MMTAAETSTKYMSSERGGAEEDLPYKIRVHCAYNIQ